MSIVEPQQPGYLSHSDAAAAPLERFPHRQTLIVSHRPQSLSSPSLSISDQSIAFTECGQHRDRQSLSGSPDALPRRGPLRTVRARFPGTRLKQAPRLACRLSSWPLRCMAAGLPTRAVGVHEAECGGFVRVARCGLRGDRLPAARLAGRNEPLLPFVGADRFTVGVQQ